MNTLKFAFFIVFSVLFQGSTYAQEWVSYQSQQQINDLVDTGDELLLATDAGLVVVNKATLEKTIFNKANSNLSNNHIQTITLAPNGNAWIGTYDVILARFDGTDFQDITIPNNNAIDQYTELYDFKIAPNGDFWLGTNDGVFQRQGQTWTHYDADDLGPSFFEAWDIEINSDGEVFMASFDVHKFSDGVWSNLTETIEINAYLDAELFFSQSGDLFLAGDLDKISRFDGQNWQSYEIGFNGSQVVRFTEDVDGSIYFNTQNDGVFKLENDAFVQEVNAQTEAFNNITDYFYIDEDNNHWLNRNIHLSKNENGNIQTTLISQHTIEWNGVRNMLKGQNGKLYFINGFRENFSVLDPSTGEWSFLAKPETTISISFYNDILAFSDNDIWLATSNGLFHYTNNEWELITELQSRSLDQDSHGKIYVRSDDKIVIIDNGVISEYNVDNSPISNLYISGHGIDAEDNLWIGTGGWDGGNVIQKVTPDGVWTTYTEADHPVIDRPGGDFHFDINGNVWVTNGNIGAIKFDGTEFTNPFIGNLDQMASYKAYSIESDAAGKVYFGHQYGVTTLMNGVWEDLLIEDVPQVVSSHGSSIKFDDEGNLWWASNRYGVFAYTSEITSTINTDFEAANHFSIYPNPTVNYSILDFTIKESSTVKAHIYNQLGQLMSSLELGQLSVGTYQKNINLAGFAKGIYSMQLQIDNKVSAKSFIVQ